MARGLAKLDLLSRKGEPAVFSKYWAISLVSHASKILLKILLERIRAKVEYELDETHRTSEVTLATALHVLR